MRSTKSKSKLMDLSSNRYRFMHTCCNAYSTAEGYLPEDGLNLWDKAVKGGAEAMEKLARNMAIEVTMNEGNESKKRAFALAADIAASEARAMLAAQ